MKTIRYDKLVRDKIPEIIEANGQVGYFHTLNEAEYLNELHKKLKEELKEYLNSTADDEAVEELADLSETIDAILKLKKITDAEFLNIRQKKLSVRGGFQTRLFLEKVEVPSDPQNEVID